MNKKQRIVIIIGIILVLICGLFPPYEGECKFYNRVNKFYEHSKVDLGYQFIFSPSLKLKTFNKIHSSTLDGLDEEDKPDKIPSAEASKISVNIKTTKLMVQMGVILLVTVGFVFVFSVKTDTGAG